MILNGKLQINSGQEVKEHVAIDVRFKRLLCVTIIFELNCKWRKLNGLIISLVDSIVHGSPLRS